MTNTQLILAILIPTLIPSLTVIVGIVLNSGRFNSMDSRFMSVENRLTAIEASNASMRERLTAIETSNVSIRERLNKLEPRSVA